MKKLVALMAAVLCVVLVCPSVFATAADDAYRAFERAITKAATAEYYEWEETHTIRTNQYPDLLETQYKTTAKALVADNNKIEVEMHTVFEDGAKLDEYYKNDYLYVNSDGVKSRAKTDYEDIMCFYRPLPDAFPQEYFTKATITQLDDGGSRITFKIPTGYYDDEEYLIQNVRRYLGSETLSVRVSNTSHSVVVDKNGNLVSHRMAYSLVLTDGKKTERVVYYIDTAIKSMNKAVSVQGPSDPGNYRSVK